MVKQTLLYSCVALFFACENAFDETLIEEERTNPYDAVFDSGDFRIVLEVEEVSDTAIRLRWTQAIFKKDVSGDDKDKFSANGDLLALTGELSEAQIELIKQNEASGAGSALRSVNPRLKGDGGSERLTKPTSTTTYFIEANYTFKGDSGVVHSNVIEYTP